MNGPGIINIIAIATIVVLSLYSIFWHMRFMKREHFVCPKCHYEFKPKILKLILSQNAVDGKIMRCPQCKKVVFLKPVKDRKE